MLMELGKSLVIAKKDMLMYYLKGPVVIFGVILPLFLFLAFYVGRELPLTFLIPGLLSMTLFFSSSAVSPVIAPWETQMKTLERLISCPISVSTMVLGDVLASSAFGVMLSVVPIFLGVFFGVVPIHPLTLAASMVLGAFCFSSLMLILSAYPTRVPATVMMLSSLLKFPLVFISGIFIPLESLPLWGVAVSLLSPLTYFTELARYCIAGSSYLSPLLCFAALTAFSALFFAIATKLHEASIPKRL